jgi:hypothetical protein
MRIKNNEIPIIYQLPFLYMIDSQLAEKKGPRQINHFVRKGV